VNIGDQVLYEGRVYVLLGVDPMSVPDRKAVLDDASSGERKRVPLSALEPTSDGPEFEPEGLG
jgi:hypothetical protein